MGSSICLLLYPLQQGCTYRGCGAPPARPDCPEVLTFYPNGRHCNACTVCVTDMGDGGAGWVSRYCIMYRPTISIRALARAECMPTFTKWWDCKLFKVG